jgi:hypothetical protein
MSKSFKKNPIGKTKGIDKDNYWKRVRGTTKTMLRSKDIEELEEASIPDPKTIVNDYDYIDQWYICDGGEQCRCIKDYGYKKCVKK